MRTSCASNGSTSAGSAFWLMPVMRRKERKGPGMVTSLVIGPGLRWTSGGPPGKPSEVLATAITKRTNRQRERLMDPTSFPQSLAGVSQEAVRRNPIIFLDDEGPDGSFINDRNITQARIQGFEPTS